MPAPHPFWAAHSADSVDVLFEAQRLLARALNAEAFESPPKGDDELRPWIALACLAGDFRALSALSASAGPAAFCFGPREARLAAEAAKAGPYPFRGVAFWANERPSAWHLCLMADSLRLRRSEPINAGMIAFLSTHPASKAAIGLSPCSVAVACARLSTAQIKRWAQALPEIAAPANAPNLAQALAQSEDSVCWESCLGLARSTKKLQGLLLLGAPTAAQTLAAGPTPAGRPGLSERVGLAIAQIEAAAIGAVAPARSKTKTKRSI